MGTALQVFVKQNRSVERSMEYADIQNKPLSEKEHNASAQVLRNGLQVMIFCQLEDFFRKRYQELISSSDFLGESFSGLPASIQSYFVEKALLGVSFKSQMSADLDQQSILDEAGKIGNVKLDNLEYSYYGFGYSKSNISYREVDELAKAFGVSSGMATVKEFVANCGFPLPSDMKSIYTNIAASRHSAAHDPSCGIQVSDLKNHVKYARIIAMGFDVVMTTALSLSQCGGTVTAPNFKMIKKFFVDKEKVGYVLWQDEVLQNAQSSVRNRAVKIESNIEDLIRYWNRRKNNTNSLVVIRDAAKIPVNWCFHA